MAKIKDLPKVDRPREKHVGAGHRKRLRDRFLQSGLDGFLDSPQAVVFFLREKIGKEKKEHFLILALDSRNNLIKDYEISVGTLNASIVHPREVFKAAIQALAAYVILAHNHPSGDPEPSRDDLEITKRLVEAGKILGIEVADHIIVAKDNFLSFREQGLI